ncbi:hypothetical protein [Candidatus Nitrospira bockiana]
MTHKVTIQVNEIGQGKLFVDDIDLSNYVRSVAFRATVGGAPELTVVVLEIPGVAIECLAQAGVTLQLPDTQAQEQE